MANAKEISNRIKSIQDTMKITKEYIHIITWHRKFLDLQEEITRESLDWRFFMIDILKESLEGSGH